MLITNDQNTTISYYCVIFRNPIDSIIVQDRNVLLIQTREPLESIQQYKNTSSDKNESLCVCVCLKPLKCIARTEMRKKRKNTATKL